MKHVTFLMVMAALAAPAPALTNDWQGDLIGAAQNFDGTVAVTWGSKYIWRGFDIYDDKSATHFLADVSLHGVGLGGSVAGHRANSSGFEDRERWDYTLYYQNSLFAKEPAATQFRFGWVYYDYPELNEDESLNLQEAHLLLSWPSILPVQGLCPTYELIKMWPAKSDSVLPDSASGWMHIFMLDYGFALPGMAPRTRTLVKLHSEIIYNDGLTITPARPRNDWTVVHPNPDHDWSNAVFGVSTDLEVIKDFVFTPAVYYQTTLNNTINEDDDEVWATLNLRYTF
jgi:hypothetical protein